MNALIPSLNFVSFSNLGLTEVPIEIVNSNITDLSLNNNSLTTLDNLPSTLKILTCKSNYLTSLSKNLLELPYIVKLDISFNCLTSIKGISSLTKLETLLLQKNDLNKADFLEITCLKRIIQLDLSENKLRNTVNIECLYNIPTLEYLCLNDNELKYWIIAKDMLSLQQLHMKGNSLKDLIVNCEAPIEILNLSNNELTSIKDIFKLKKLQELHLEYNNITEIQNEINDCSLLKVLNLSYNRIITMPVLKLKLLEMLFINSNELTSLSFTIELPSLSELHVSSNSLSEALTTMSIKKLDISHNRVKDLDKLKNTRIEELNISYNNIKSDIQLFKQIANIKTLKRINLKGNPLIERSDFKQRLITMLPLLEIDGIDISFSRKVKEPLTTMRERPVIESARIDIRERDLKSNRSQERIKVLDKSVLRKSQCINTHRCYRSPSKENVLCSSKDILNKSTKDSYKQTLKRRNSMTMMKRGRKYQQYTLIRNTFNKYSKDNASLPLSNLNTFLKDIIQHRHLNKSITDVIIDLTKVTINKGSLSWGDFIKVVGIEASHEPVIESILVKGEFEYLGSIRKILYERYINKNPLITSISEHKAVADLFNINGHKVRKVIGTKSRGQLIEQLLNENKSHIRTLYYAEGENNYKKLLRRDKSLLYYNLPFGETLSAVMNYLKLKTKTSMIIVLVDLEEYKVVENEICNGKKIAELFTIYDSIYFQKDCIYVVKNIRQVYPLYLVEYD